MRKLASIAAAATVLAGVVAGGSASASTITKSPLMDYGGYWTPLNTSGGSTVFANSFVSPDSGVVTSMGIWFSSTGGDTSHQPIAFEIIGSTDLGAPDLSNVLATTGTIYLNATSALDLFSAPTTTSAALSAGQTYWIVADERGLVGAGTLGAGIHQQNTDGIVDNGAFWTMAADGTFGPDTSTPSYEMAFTVSVPEPASLMLLAAGLGVLGLVRRRPAC